MNVNDLIVTVAADLNTLTEHLIQFVQQAAEKKEKTASKKASEKKEAAVPTIEDVRAVLAEKSRAGHTDEVRKLITDCGANALSEVDPSKYAWLIEKAKEIADA